MNSFFTHGIPIWYVLVYMIYMAAVQSLPRPDETSGKLYVFLYGFMHLLSINLNLAFDPRKQSDTAIIAKSDAARNGGTTPTTPGV
jgi:hypothetical protein